MSESPTMGPIEVQQGFKNEGPLSPPNIHSFTGTGGGGIIMIRGKKSQITSVVGNSGAGLTMINKSEGGLGDGKKTPGGERKDKNIAAGNTDTSKQTITRLGNPDGTGLVIVSGGDGGNPTLSIALGDKSCSITMSARGSGGGPVVTVVAGTHEWTLDYKGFKVTKMPIQEKLCCRADIDSSLDAWADAMKTAFDPFTQNKGSGRWGH